MISDGYYPQMYLTYFLVRKTFLSEAKIHKKCTETQCQNITSVLDFRMRLSGIQATLIIQGVYSYFFLE